MVMVEASRAGFGPKAGPEEEALGLVFPKAIGAGFGGGSRQIWRRSRMKEKGDLEQDEERARKAWVQR